MPADEIICVNDVELYVRRLGDPALPALVVVHGGPTWDHSYLLPAVAELADAAHVVLFDLRGCGRSARTAPAGSLPEAALQPDYLADDVAALIGRIGAGSATVLGFSYGGGVAMRVADQHPGVVRRLILASTTAYGDYQDELDQSADYRERGRLCARIDVADPALTVPDAADGALSAAIAHGGAPRDVWHLDRLDEWHRILDRVRFSSDWNGPYAAGLLPPARPDDAPRVLRAWGGPVLILQGARDMTFPVGVARRLHAEVPGSMLAEIPDAGHMAHFDNQAAWLAAIRAFLCSR